MKSMIGSTSYTGSNGDRGVSPVIGTILMVAIAVILAAVVGSFVLGIGGDLSQSPQVSLDVSDAADDVDNEGVNSGDGPDDIIVIEHSGGDSLESSNLELTVTNTSGESYSLEELPETISAGDRITLTEIRGSGAPRADAEVGGTGIQPETSIEIIVRIVHKPSDSLLLDAQITIQ